jgi:spoIIIJ-associated protein
MVEQTAEKAQAIEAIGEEVEAAIAAGLARLGVDRDAVDIEVLDEGTRGLFGLRAREARVRLTVRPRAAPAVPAESVAPLPVEPAAPVVAEKDEAEVAQGVLTELLALLGMEMDDVQVGVRRAEPVGDEREPPLMLDVHGSGIEPLIGRRGSTLAALQLITRLIVGREMMDRVHLVVDVDGFKARREQSLRLLAQRLAEQAVRTNRPVVLEPMPPHERRYVHLALRDHPHVITESIGEGDRRKVTIIPRR